MSTYDIVIEGRVQGPLLRALEGFEVVDGDGRQTRFRGSVADQGALRAVLRRISGSNLRLTSVTMVAGDPDSRA